MDNYDIYKNAAKACGFYDIPIWKIDQPKPDYYDLFIWGPNFFGQNDSFGGVLNESLFDTIEKKIAYIQGVFEDYSGSALSEGYIHFANSTNKVERCKKWINEVCYKKISESSALYTSFNLSFPIKEHNIKYSCPICHTLVLSNEGIKYIKEYKL